jgi:hypothetical protein
MTTDTKAWKNTGCKKSNTIIQKSREMESALAVKVSVLAIFCFLLNVLSVDLVLLLLQINDYSDYIFK